MIMKKKIDYGLIGFRGRLGNEVKNLFTEKGYNLVYSSDIDGENLTSKPQILIDCSLPGALNQNIKTARRFNSPYIIAVTGLSDSQMKSIKALSQTVPVVQSFNFSLGIQVLLSLSRTAAALLENWDIEISETHHRNKKDRPSGTAKMIQSVFRDRHVNVSSQRLGGIPGDHSVEFGGMGETLKISHHAISRRTFAEGILLSAQFIMNKKNGYYSFTDVVFRESGKT
jgi:4-hydroxy-tetrahydrodipicolinate reductase